MFLIGYTVRVATQIQKDRRITTKKVVMCVLAAAPSQAQEIQHCWSSNLQGQQQAVVNSETHHHVSVGKIHRGAIPITDTALWQLSIHL